jgi:hypothetical protein
MRLATEEEREKTIKHGEKILNAMNKLKLSNRQALNALTLVISSIVMQMFEGRESRPYREEIADEVARACKRTMRSHETLYDEKKLH